MAKTKEQVARNKVEDPERSRREQGDETVDSRPSKKSPQMIEKPTKWAVLRRTLWVLFMIAVVGAGVWYYQQNIIDELRADNAALTVQLKESKAAQKKAETELATAQEQAASAAASVVPTVPPVTKENIAAAISSKNYAALSGYMADKVTYAVAASSATGSLTKAQAIEKLSFLDSATLPWNFAIDNTTLIKYKSGNYKAQLSDNVMFGAAANKYFVSFHFDASNKIDRMFMSVTTDLL